MGIDFSFLDFREAGKKSGGAVRASGRLVDVVTMSEEPQPPVKSLWSEQKVLIVVHGYDVNEDEGADYYRATLGYLATGTHPFVPDRLVGVFWPGDHSWAWKLGYPSEARDADMTAQRLCEFIADYVSPDADLYFLAHSLGSRVTMSTLSRLAMLKERGFDTPKVHQTCLMAGAIDHDSLSLRGAKGYRRGTLHAQKLGVFSSPKDRALGVVYGLGDLGQWLFSPSSERWGKALGRHGIAQHPDVSHWDAEMVAQGNQEKQHGSQADIDHGDYLLTVNSVGVQRQKQCGNLNAALRFFAGGNL